MFTPRKNCFFSSPLVAVGLRNYRVLCANGIHLENFAANFIKPDSFGLV